MNADGARSRLLAQHDQIRVLLNECSVLARQLRNGEPVYAELDRLLAQLRNAFSEHNAIESTLIRSLLNDSPNWGALLVDRMLEEHLAEHAAFWELLAGSAAEVVTRMDDLVDELDAHMAAEERTFLSPLVLDDNAINLRREERP